MKKETVFQRIRIEIMMRHLIKAGYSRKVANKWCRRIINDTKHSLKNGLSKNEINKIHKSNFLCSTVKRFHIDDLDNTDCISDFEYLYLRPFNNSFEKWIHEIVFTNRMLKNHKSVCRGVYFNVVKRGDEHLIIPVGGSEKKCSIEDVISLLKEKGELEFRPAFWQSKYQRFTMKYDHVSDSIAVNEECCSVDELNELINSRKVLYIISDLVPIDCIINGEEMECIIKVWITNDMLPEAVILSSEVQRYWDEIKVDEHGEKKNIREMEAAYLDINTGKFVLKGNEYSIAQWDDIKAKIVDIGNELRQLSYFTLSIALDKNSLFKIVSTSTNPILPQGPFNSELNNYLKSEVESKKKYEIITNESRRIAASNSIKNKLIKKFCRKGVRPYMQKLWFDALKDDWKNTKGVSVLKLSLIHI